MSENLDKFRAHVSSEQDWRGIVQIVSDFPPLPHTAMQAMKLMEDSNVSTSQITAVISKDTALAARVLRISNSAMFVRRAKVTTLHQAILMLGSKTLKGIILAATLQGINRRDSALENLVWRNSVCVALCASHLTKILKHNFVEESFTLGLLHDLGKVALVSQIPKQYTELAKLTRQGRTFVEVEQENFGYTHALLGALISKKWNFPDEISQVILHHHDPLELPLTNEIMLRTGVIQAADLVAHTIGVGHEDGYPDMMFKAIEILVLIGIPENRADLTIEECSVMYSERVSKT